jgi:hypothetical protein
MESGAHHPAHSEKNVSAAADKTGSMEKPAVKSAVDNVIDIFHGEIIEKGES